MKLALQCVQKVNFHFTTHITQMEKHLKRGKYDGEYTEIFKKTSKLYVESASIVSFKVNFMLAAVQNGGHTISDEGGKVTDKIIKAMNWDSDMICSLLSLCPL